MLDVIVLLHIFEQVEAELVQAQIHNRNTCVHLLDVNHFFLQTKKLVATIFQVALFFGRNRVVIAGGGEHRYFHTSFHASL